MAATAQESEQRAQIAFLDCAPELVSAINDGKATFLHVALAYQFGHREPAEGQCSPEDRDVCRANFKSILASYERDHGRITRAYFANHVFAAAALTDRDEIGILLGGGDSGIVDPAVARMIMRAQELGYAAWHRLHKYDRRQCQSMVFSVIVELLRRHDLPGAPPAPPLNGHKANGAGNGRPVDEPDDDELVLLAHQLDEAEDFMLRCATRRTQIHYLRGMAWGLIGVALLIGAVLTVLALTGHVTQLAGRLMLVALAGGVGSVASVASRMTSSSFQMNLPSLSQDSRDTNVEAVAAVRPWLGAVIGLGVFTIIGGGLMHVDVSSAHDPQAATMLYAALAFLSGFSERLAQDVFVRSGQGILGAFGDTPDSGPSAGLAPPPGGRNARRAPARTVVVHEASGSPGSDAKH